MPTIEEILPQVAESGELTRAEALALLGRLNRVQAMLLFSLATAQTEAAFGGQVEFCAIINARSGRCSEDCLFCAQSSRYQTEAASHGLLPLERVTEAARAAREGGARRFSVVTSGKAASDKDVDLICRQVEAIAGLGLKPCASLGCLAEPALKRLRSAGLDRFHHNLEAAPSFYPAICTSHDYQERVATLEAARSAGLTLCSGGIFGLGETLDQRWELIAELRRLGVDSVAVNFLNPIPGTPLEGQPLLDPLEALAILAVIRLAMPQAEIRTCGGRIQTLGPLSPLQYLAGANATMTGDYLTTSGPRPDNDLAELARLGLSLIK